MTYQQILARLAEIKQQIETRSGELNEETLTALTTETDELMAKKTALEQQNEQRAALHQRIATGLEQVTTIQSFPATDAPESRGAEQPSADPYDTPEYRNAFMRFCQDGTAIPMELRATMATTDVTAVIPTTTLNEIIREFKQFGNLYNSVRKLNIQGGVHVPILSLIPEAHWIDESNTSADQKLQANTRISFSYFGIEAKIAQTLLASVTTYAAFQSLLVPLAAEAIVRRLEIDIISGDGDGKLTGVTKDSRVPTSQVLTLTPEEFSKWDQWKKKVFAKMKLRYRNGNFYMAAGTFDGYIDGMVDTNGQPIGRVNYGLADGPVYRFGGKRVELVEDEVIKNYETAADGDVVAVFFNPTDYAINSNMQMHAVRWTDNDNNVIKDKVIMICDGKLIDTNGVLIVKKGSGGV